MTNKVSSMVRSELDWGISMFWDKHFEATASSFLILNGHITSRFSSVHKSSLNWGVAITSVELELTAERVRLPRVICMIEAEMMSAWKTKRDELSVIGFCLLLSIQSNVKILKVKSERWKYYEKV